MKNSMFIDLKTLEGVKIDEINRSYIGKQGCACGCGGNYHETNRMKKSSLTKLKTKCNDGELIEVVKGIMGDTNIICWEGETRAIRIYTKQNLFDDKD